MAILKRSPATRELPATFGEEALRALPSAAKEPAWLSARRREALERAAERAFPMRDDPQWRRTDPARFRLDGLTPAPAAGPGSGEALNALLRDLPQAEGRGGLVATVDGVVVREDVSPEVAAAGTVLAGFDSAARGHGDMLQAGLPPATARADRWSHLNAAFVTGGALVRVPRGATVEAPLWVLHRVDAPGRAAFLHTVIHVEAGASVTVVELLHGDDAAASLAHQELDVRVEAGGRLRYLRIQELGAATAFLSSERLLLERDASAEWGWGALGAAVARSEMTASLRGEGSHAVLAGFYHGAGTRHLDHRTFQDHVKGHTTSDLLYKGALEQRGSSVYTGLIKVHKDAQRSDAYQANRNLLLADTARADSIPSLEIEANDVRCTHGATVGQLDEEQLFYLRSRGIRRSEAARLIVEGFYEPVFDRLGAESLRDLARARLTGRLIL
ncbi:MAG: Fe-S cluster assembly protein SufD [Candidatus Eisenbacteria bacterium]|nr:Fe-S cluster assembly protein SufD [Candidatus Eisenbacteria bacterium]